MNTWETIKKDDVPQDATLLNCHVVWALKKKGSGEIEKFKARLVADGNTQRPGLDYDRVLATVVKMSTLRILLTVAVVDKRNLTSVDVRQAFLLAKLDRPQYMRMPTWLATL